MTAITKKYYDSAECIWIEERNTDGSENESFELSIKGKLKSALQMPNIMVLADSGTSLGDVVNGPRMWDLWEACTTNDMLSIANDCFSESGFDSGVEANQNIEICLSHCEAYLQVGTSIEKTTLFIKKCKELILQKCHFIKDKNAQLVGHKEFIRKLARRKSKDPRVKLFTTNYDTCFVAILYIQLKVLALLVCQQHAFKKLAFDRKI